MSSADGPLKLDARLETQGHLVYVPIAITGENGALESNADLPVSIAVTGGRLLGLGSARPETEEGFLETTVTTYYGKAQAVIEKGEGVLQVTISAPGLETTALNSF